MPARLLNPPGPTRISSGTGIRTVKMMYPRCDQCQDASRTKTTWWESCPHDPYFSVSEEDVREPQLGEVLEDGSREIVGEKVMRVQRRSPNLRQVAVNLRLNSGQEVEQRRAQGYIMPEEHPTDPLKPFCQYHDCWSQNLKVKSVRFGSYCDERQARMVGLDARGRPVSVEPDLRREQLADITL